MAKVKDKVVHTVKVGGRHFKVRTDQPIFPRLVDEQFNATIPQFRHLAYSSATLLAEKILAGTTRGASPKIKLSDIEGLKPGYSGLAPRRPFRHIRLNDEYWLRKVREGKDPRPLIATGFYITNLTIREKRRKGGGHIWVVLVPNKKHPVSGVRLPVLARWLEFGTPESSPGDRMPARPHWRPVANVVKRAWRRLPEDIRVAALKKVLRELR